MLRQHGIRRRMAATTPLILAVLLLAFVIAVSLTHDRALARMAAETLIRVTLVVGFWIFVGNSGVVSFGHAAFACLGAYVSAWTTLKPAMKATLLPGLPDWLAAAEWPVAAAAVAGGGVAALVALATGAAILRLSGIAASIATFAFLAMVNTIWSNWTPMTGGTSSVVGLERYVTPWAALAWAVVALAVAAAYGASASGLALRATREDEVAAAASGIDRYRHRLLAYTLSAFFCGVGGALTGHFIGVINPDSFYLSLTFLMLAMLVVGGIGSLSGAVAGVMALSLAVELLVRMEKGVTLGVTTFALPPGSQEIIIAVAMILVLIFRPAGLLAGREIMLPARWVGGRADRTTDPTS
ncbi:branched-chain amino acid ABC transporter permease [Tabrizicola sp.]|jgi:branched-chain amino acid transport system permease protein|uniref:branched-chain amino acid ABC transporter permease n=1 Tax=Tabrizicola sp. TaxID=2005166 RepID=UPI001A4CC0CC|nr:branched-chain amino acid ABC transporter permease [Tabrizicola sp.]MBL9063088.1 branched-chain amino acid ABC transporter permease [Tabrizicola sp.]